VSNVPEKHVILSEEVKALPSDQLPPIPLKPIPPDIVTPLVVIVFPAVVALKLTAAVVLHIVPARRVIDPYIENEGEVPFANVTVPAETVISKQFKAPVQVTV
jgi:hypothetical protein